MSLSLDQIYQTLWVPTAGNRPVFPPVLERLPVCGGRRPDRSVLHWGQRMWVCEMHVCSQEDPPPPHTPNAAGDEMDSLLDGGLCLNQRNKQTKKITHPFCMQQLNGKSPKWHFLFSPCWSERGTLKSTNDWFVGGRDDSTNGSLLRVQRGAQLLCRKGWWFSIGC